MMNLLKEKRCANGPARCTRDRRCLIYLCLTVSLLERHHPSMGGSPRRRHGSPLGSCGSRLSGRSPVADQRVADLFHHRAEALRRPRPIGVLNLDINAKWKFDVEGAMSDPVEWICSGMKEQPRPAGVLGRRLLRHHDASHVGEIRPALSRHFAGEVDTRVRSRPAIRCSKATTTWRSSPRRCGSSLEAPRTDHSRGVEPDRKGAGHQRATSLHINDLAGDPLLSER